MLLVCHSIIVYASILAIQLSFRHAGINKRACKQPANLLANWQTNTLITPPLLYYSGGYYNKLYIENKCHIILNNIKVFQPI